MFLGGIYGIRTQGISESSELAPGSRFLKRFSQELKTFTLQEAFLRNEEISLYKKLHLRSFTVREASLQD